MSQPSKKLLLSLSAFDDETFDFVLRYNPKHSAEEHVPMVAAFLSAGIEQFAAAIAENHPKKDKLEVAQDILDRIQKDIDQA